MNRILNNIIKGLLVTLVLIIVGGILWINLKLSPNTSMVLVSSSLVNSLKTDKTSKITKEVEKVELVEEKEKEEIKEKTEEENEEKVEEVIEKEEEKIEPVVVEEKKEEVVESAPVEEKIPSVPSPSGSYEPNSDTASSSDVTATYTGLVTAYGPDCYGCYGSLTAMGDYVGEGNIYYNHPTYGTIRIVAGDRSILNKVVRITGLNISSEPVIAIVRDTGGDIGFNKPKGIILDLLFTSEKSQEVLNFGMQYATVEVLN